jgi:hypothetical protein
MTPREHQTLQIILHHVSVFHGCAVNCTELRSVVVLANQGKPHAGDAMILAVNFGRRAA